MLQGIPMYAEFFIDKKQISCYYHISHIFRQYQSIQKLTKMTS